MPIEKMAPTKTMPSPAPLAPRSPAAQNVQVRSPFGKALPLRKPSLKDSISSPKRAANDQIPIADSLPASKRRRLDTASEQNEGTDSAQDFDVAEHMNDQTAAKYVKGKKLGSGTYANVYKGHLKSDPSQLFAIKKFKINQQTAQDGINVDTIREIKYLQELSHRNIIRLYDVYSSKDQTINAILEFCDGGDLEEMIKDTNFAYGLADIKAWMGMLMRAIYFCHRNFVLHRDIKPGNLLIAHDGELKLADFGLGRRYGSPDEKMTREVITLWYRPPELMFGARQYGGAVDIWSCALILAELVLRRPFIAYAEDPDALATGGGELGQLEIMNQALGTPVEENWPGVSKLKNYVELTPRRPLRDKRGFREIFRSLDDSGLDLMRAMLTYEPLKRPTAKQSLEHDWWTLEPRPSDKENLPRKKNVNEKKMGEQIAKEPGVLEDGEKYQGVARKLDFGAKK